MDPYFPHNKYLSGQHDFKMESCLQSKRDNSPRNGNSVIIYVPSIVPV